MNKFINRKGHLHNYAIFIASRWFKTIDDFINLETSSPRFLGNLEKYFYNPIPLNIKTKALFPNLRTLYLYNPNDDKFEDDENIIARVNCKIDKYDLYNYQCLTLQKWIKRKLKTVIFDSNIHNWDVFNSEFKERIYNKSNLIFIIEDEKKNKFGYYFKSNINKCDSWIPSISSFMFSLEYRGNINTPCKFNTCFPFNTFWLYQDYSCKLINIGDICLNKKSSKESSYCDLDKWNFYYNHKEYLFGENNKTKFNINPKRILVISTK